MFDPAILYLIVVLSSGGPTRPLEVSFKVDTRFVCEIMEGRVVRSNPHPYFPLLKARIAGKEYYVLDAWCEDFPLDNLS